MKIFDKLCLRELLKTFFLVLICFYFLYVLIDYASHITTLHQEGLAFSYVILYYLFQFVEIAPLLLPTAFIIAVIKTLTTFNLKNELVAMVTAGFSLKRICLPFLTFALTITMILYLNFEFISPIAHRNLDIFEAQFFTQKSKNDRSVHHLNLEDQSLILYQQFDPKEETFFDLFWVVSPDEIYHAKTFHLQSHLGSGVDHLIRLENGELVKDQSDALLSLPNLKISNQEIQKASHPPAWKSLSELIPSLFIKPPQAKLMALVLQKLSLPLVSILALLAIAPFCVTFSRRLPVFLIYALGLFGLISFFTLVKASFILGENHILSPFWAICLPYFLFFSIFGIRYAKL